MNKLLSAAVLALVACAASTSSAFAFGRTFGLCIHHGCCNKCCCCCTICCRQYNAFTPCCCGDCGGGCQAPAPCGPSCGPMGCPGPGLPDGASYGPPTSPGSYGPPVGAGGYAPPTGPGPSHGYSYGASAYPSMAASGSPLTSPVQAASYRPTAGSPAAVLPVQPQAIAAPSYWYGN